MGAYNDDVLKGMLSKLDNNMNQLNCNLVLMSQRKLPIYVNEYNYSYNDVRLVVSAKSRGAIIVTSLLAVSTSAATVMIGSHVIPVAANQPLNAQGLRWIVNSGDQRVLIQTTTGAMSLELFGEEVGDVGIL